VTIVGALQFYLFQLRSCCPSPCCRSHLRACVLQELLPSAGSCCRSHSRAGMLQELLPSAGSDGARVAARCCWSHPARGRPPLHELLPSAGSGGTRPRRAAARSHPRAWRPPGAATLRQERRHVGHDMQLPVASSRAPSGTTTHRSRAATRCCPSPEQLRWGPRPSSPRQRAHAEVARRLVRRSCRRCFRFSKDSSMIRRARPSTCLPSSDSSDSFTSVAAGVRRRCPELAHQRHT
jgi:hypothetical protein